MGLFDKLQNMATGANTPENDAAQKKARDLFNSKVANGADYQIVGCYYEKQSVSVGRTLIRGRVSTNATFYSYLIGYKENPKELVVLPVERELTTAEEPIVVTPSEAKATKGMMGYSIKSDKLNLSFVINNSKMSGNWEYVLEPTYFNEQKDFDEFFKNFNN